MRVIEVGEHVDEVSGTLHRVVLTGSREEVRAAARLLYQDVTIVPLPTVTQATQETPATAPRW